jgi:uncharacterized protein
MVRLAGEENPNAALTAAAGAAAGSVRHRPDLAPYEGATRWRAGPALGVTIIICAVTVILALGGSFIVMGGGGDAPTTGSEGRILPIMLFAQIVMTLGAVFAARAKIGDALVSVLALKAPAGGFGAYARSLALVLGVVGVFTLVSHFALSHDATADLKETAALFRGPWWPLALVVIGIGAPVSEELLFRGFLQSALVPTWLGYWGASVVSTALWTVMHAGYSIVGLVEVFLIGLVLCYLLRRTGSLRVTLACHGIYNSLIALVVIFAPKAWLGF